MRKKLTREQYAQIKTLKEQALREATIKRSKHELVIVYEGRTFVKKWNPYLHKYAKRWTEIPVDKTGDKLTIAERHKLKYLKRTAKWEEIAKAHQEKRFYQPVEFKFKGVVYISYPNNSARGWTAWVNKEEHLAKLKAKGK